MYPENKNSLAESLSKHFVLTKLKTGTVKDHLSQDYFNVIVNGTVVHKDHSVILSRGKVFGWKFGAIQLGDHSDLQVVSDTIFLVLSPDDQIEVLRNYDGFDEHILRKEFLERELYSSDFWTLLVKSFPLELRI
jgi:signal-transduction protein with cAMP-binding, CBS, and nucleotidyltransferase domain